MGREEEEITDDLGFALRGSDDAYLTWAKTDGAEKSKAQVELVGGWYKFVVGDSLDKAVVLQKAKVQAEQEAPAMCGFLWKASVDKTWRKRWFQIENNRLAYYKGKGQTTAGGSVEWNEVVKYHPCVTVELHPQAKPHPGRYYFGITYRINIVHLNLPVTPVEKMLLLQTDSPEKYKEWTEAVNTKLGHPHKLHDFAHVTERQEDDGADELILVDTVDSDTDSDEETVTPGGPCDEEGPTWFIEGFYNSLLPKIDSVGVTIHDQILRDLPRTAPGHRDNEALQKRLSNVLHCYAKKNPHIGYCQGMSFFAAIALCAMTDEQAFWVMSFIVENLLPDYYAALSGAAADGQVIEWLAKQHCPKIAAHLDSMLRVLVTPWLIGVLSTTLPSHAVLMAWSRIFRQGRCYLYRTIVGMLAVLGEKLENRIVEFEKNNPPEEMDHMTRCAVFQNWINKEAGDMYDMNPVWSWVSSHMASTTDEQIIEQRQEALAAYHAEQAKTAEKRELLNSTRDSKLDANTVARLKEQFNLMTGGETSKDTEITFGQFQTALTRLGLFGEAEKTEADIEPPSPSSGPAPAGGSASPLGGIGRQLETGLNAFGSWKKKDEGNELEKELPNSAAELIFYKQLFMQWDTDNSGKINFHELLCGLAGGEETDVETQRQPTYMEI
eukprot:TRINITY_DN84625_c0_g1_i2.p1 TRINITY_DN84625_c0_g1~~TRINITY_DN84625_c0_g1_i2.p1  ORF type:complete len:665 (-),score=64.59 TRINITY_DN84625_c0_g1_i2:233-2227(-)